MAYHCPTDLTAALQIVAQSGGKVIAGGTDVYPAARQGENPDYYLDVTRIAGFSDISEGPDGFRFGAATTWRQIAGADLPPAFDALKQAARAVGGVQIQNAGTIAGNLSNASPAADGVPPLLTLEAQVTVASQERGKRDIPLAKFIMGVRQTALAPDELITSILVPTIPRDARSAFEKLGSRRYLVISIAMTSALIARDAEGRITCARVAVGACSPVAQRLPELEWDLIGKRVNEVNVTPRHLSPLSPIDDARGSAEYRRDVVSEQCTRAIRRAAGDE
ncbi:FAD binding domain-containing protein [uncultured Roseovarius sp.]|uniref:FAD binding domain-containing protein n=1 Tax=uncultured Roseovarius sp. TaxID=293344 RepID=UPI00262114C1|nr:FAD binding domain-containing protein [uncultured Roseovarius sp.]